MPAKLLLDKEMGDGGNLQYECFEIMAIKNNLVLASWF